MPIHPPGPGITNDINIPTSGDYRNLAQQSILRRACNVAQKSALHINISSIPSHSGSQRILFASNDQVECTIGVYKLLNWHWKIMPS